MSQVALEWRRSWWRSPPAWFKGHELHCLDVRAQPLRVLNPVRIGPPGLELAVDRDHPTQHPGPNERRPPDPRAEQRTPRGSAYLLAKIGSLASDGNRRICSRTISTSLPGFITVRRPARDPWGRA